MDLLIHVGLHKTGSTWLQDYVFRDSDLGFVSPWGGMAHKAVTEFVVCDPILYDPDASRQAFEAELAAVPDAVGKTAVISHEALSSRPHHGLYYAPVTALRLKRAFPEAKLFFVFREQSRIIFSLYGEHVRNGGRHTLEQFLGTGQEPAGWTPLCQLSFFEYDRLLNMYKEIFGPDRVLALPLELLKSDPEEFGRRLMGFCGQDPKPLQSSSVSNPGWGANTTSFYRRSNALFMRNPLGPKQTTAYRLRERLVWKIDRIIPRGWQEAKRRHWRDLVEKRLGDQFSHSNTRMAEAVNINLKELGYT